LQSRALAKLARLQKSPNYKSFFEPGAVEAFANVKSSAFAGTPVRR
jgi:hypothetical protein